MWNPWLMNWRSVPVGTETVRGKKSLKAHRWPAGTADGMSAVTVAIRARTDRSRQDQSSEHEQRGAGRSQPHRVLITKPPPARSADAHPGAVHKVYNTDVARLESGMERHLWCPRTTDAPSATDGAALTGERMHAHHHGIGRRPAGRPSRVARACDTSACCSVNSMPHFPTPARAHEVGDLATTETADALNNAGVRRGPKKLRGSRPPGVSMRSVSGPSGPNAPPAVLLAASSRPLEPRCRSAKTGWPHETGSRSPIQEPCQHTRTRAVSLMHRPTTAASPPEGDHSDGRTAMRQRTMSISQIRTVAIPVADQERSLAFYTEILGFEKTLDAPFGPGQRWIEVSPPGGGIARDPAARRIARRASTPASASRPATPRRTTPRCRPPAPTSTRRSSGFRASRRCSRSATRTGTGCTSSSGCDGRNVRLDEWHPVGSDRLAA